MLSGNEAQICSNAIAAWGTVQQPRLMTKREKTSIHKIFSAAFISHNCFTFKFLLFQQQHETLWPEFPRRNPAKQIHWVLCGTVVRHGDYSCTFTLNKRTFNAVLWQCDWAPRPSFTVVCRHLHLHLPITRLWEKTTAGSKSQIISRGHLCIRPISYKTVLVLQLSE